MPNHVHCILFFPADDFNMNIIVSNGKRFITYEIIKRLEQKGLTKLLSQLKEGLTERDLAKGQKHKSFEDSFMQSRYITGTFFYKR
jgi:REP element-mobilizing transposase RayT